MIIALFRATVHPDRIIEIYESFRRPSAEKRERTGVVDTAKQKRFPENLLCAGETFEESRTWCGT